MESSSGLTISNFYEFEQIKMGKEKGGDGTGFIEVHHAALWIVVSDAARSAMIFRSDPGQGNQLYPS